MQANDAARLNPALEDTIEQYYKIYEPMQKARSQDIKNNFENGFRIR